MFPQEKGRGEKTTRVEREQVVIVEELGVLTLGPFPDVQVIELPLGKLDGHQEVLVPVPVDSDTATGIFGLGRVAMR